MKKISDLSVIIACFLTISGAGEAAEITWSNSLTYVNTNGSAADTYSQLVNGSVIEAKYTSSADAAEQSTRTIYDTFNSRNISFRYLQLNQQGGEYGGKVSSTGDATLNHVLSDGYQGGGGQGSLILTLSGLTVGKTYRIQLFARTPYGFWISKSTPPLELQSPNTYYLDTPTHPDFEFHGPNFEAQTGVYYPSWFITGTFTADSPTQLIALYSALRDSPSPPPWGNPQVDAYIVAAAEPSDSDSDGVNDYREGKDGTDPNDPSLFNPLSKSLVAYYPFDGNANDESGYGNDASALGNIEYNDSGVSGGALRTIGDFSLFYNGGGWVQLPMFDANLNSGFTFSFWAKDEQSGGEPVHQEAYISFGQLNASLIEVGLSGISGNYVIWQNAPSDRIEQIVAPPEIASEKTWKHFVLTYTVGNLTLYRNGVAIWSVVGAKDIFPVQQASLGRHWWEYGGASSARMSCTYDSVRVFDRTLSETEAAQLYIAELGSLDRNQNGLTDAADFLPIFEANQILRGQTDVTTNPSSFNLFTQEQYAANRTNGQTDVKTNPSAYGLVTQADYDVSRTAGQNDVLADPSAYNLFTSNSIMDLNLGSLMLQKQGSSVTLMLEVQKTDNLGVTPFSSYGNFLLPVNVPGNKSFLRVQAVSNPTPTPPQ